MYQDKEEINIAKYGFKLTLDHVYPEKWSQGFLPSLKQIWTVLSLILRYLIYYVKQVWHGESIIMDYIHPLTGKQIYGVPIGGIGAGTIGRGFKGEFCRFQLKPGLYEYNTVEANQFIITIKNAEKVTIFQSLLSTYKRSSLKAWKSLIDGKDCKYTGLYPRAWTEYDLSKYGIKLICRQVSPVIPHNYKDSSLPCAIFVWNIENVSNEEKYVTISFTFKNGTGNKKADRSSSCSTKTFSYLESEGVLLYHQIDKMPCTYALGVKARNEVDVSKCLYFDPNSSGQIPWDQLYTNGKFDKTSETKSDQIFDEVACGIAAQVKVSSKANEELQFSLVWNMPIVNFPKKLKKSTKYYTNIFGTELNIVDYSLKNYTNWESAIYKWQKSVLDDEQLPDWYKSALFNESYFISDGGTLWFALDDSDVENLPAEDPRVKYGRFAYLESHEYLMYNTYDVHFYASYALAMNWPMLQISLQYDMRDAIFMVLPQRVKMWYDGKLAERKSKNTVPHDLGNPGEEPFILINGYPAHDVNDWRDLNTKFVLQVFRDYKIIKDTEGFDKKQYLADMYEACKVVMTKSEQYDIDNDGLIENSGIPDQTFDTWVMTGSSAYCGGLWLASLYAMSVIAEVLKKTDDKKNYLNMLERAKVAFDKKLWNGKYYNFDCSLNNKSTIMADQLCGFWYLRSSDCNYEVFPQEKVASCLNTIYDNNVLSFCDGNMGAVNGFTAKGEVDHSTIQSLEVWTGVTYALAATMIHENLIAEAWQTAGGMFKNLSERIGMIYQTPEALYSKKYYRAVAYMRPLCIWSIQRAWEQYRIK